MGDGGRLPDLPLAAEHHLLHEHGQEGEGDPEQRPQADRQLGLLGLGQRPALAGAEQDQPDRQRGQQVEGAQQPRPDPGADGPAHGGQGGRGRRGRFLEGAGQPGHQEQLDQQPGHEQQHGQGHGQRRVLGVQEHGQTADDHRDHGGQRPAPVLAPGVA